jgi:hypothetical protein
MDAQNYPGSNVYRAAPQGDARRDSRQWSGSTQVPPPAQHVAALKVVMPSTTEPTPPPAH